MDILILDSWLREYLDTKATPTQISKYLSLCGPSIEKIEKIKGDNIYHIEITTNRIDEVGVYGIAREASAILPRFGIKTKLKSGFDNKGPTFTSKVSYLDARVDEKLCPRFSAVLIENVKLGDSPLWVKSRLESAGIRPINNVVDISNYIMLALGQPVHTFDYDKIKGGKMILRESKKGEKITTLDGKTFALPGNDIVIEDGEGRLIDLCGIMGGENSAVDSSTKNVLLFVQTYEPSHIRKTSMALAQRTDAAAIFEKGTDTESVGPAMLTAINLFNKLTNGRVQKEILDIYPNPYKIQSINVDLDFIIKRLGVEISKTEIVNYLKTLGFGVKWQKNSLQVDVPSFRSRDIKISEDVVEEIARIYGYHNLPSVIMSGEIPTRPANLQFAFETIIKDYLSGRGGTEVYSLSLVPQKYVSEKSLKLKNPLGTESEYLRTSLMPSLIDCAKGNIGISEKFHIFEMANIYLPRVSDLPEEKLMLGGIFYGLNYRNAKGVIEALFERLHLKINFILEDSFGFGANKSAIVLVKNEEIGKIGLTENDKFIYYEFYVAKLLKLIPTPHFIEIPKFPAQIEDITFKLPEKTKVGDIIKSIFDLHEPISNVELKDIYEDAYTFRIWYQDPKKTLTNEDVEKIRTNIISSLKGKFGLSLKD